MAPGGGGGNAAQGMQGLRGGGVAPIALPPGRVAGEGAQVVGVSYRSVEPRATALHTKPSKRKVPGVIWQPSRGGRMSHYGLNCVAWALTTFIIEETLSATLLTAGREVVAMN